MSLRITGATPYAQLSDEQKEVMIRFFAQDDHEIPVLLEIDNEVNLYIPDGIATPLRRAEITSWVLERQGKTVGEVADVLYANVKSAFRNPVIGPLLHAARGMSSVPHTAPVPPASEPGAMAYARLTPDQRNAMIRLFAHDHVKLAAILGVTEEVERGVIHPAPALEFAVMLSRALSKNGGVTVAAVANALSSINPGAFHDPVVGQMLNSARRVSHAAPAAPAASAHTPATAAPSKYTWKTMYDVPGAMQLSLKRFFEGDIVNWLLLFDADAPVRGQTAQNTRSDMARGFVQYLRNRAYPLPNLARIVVGREPRAVDDPNLGEFFKFYLNQPIDATRFLPSILPVGPWTSMSQIPGSVQVELVKFFADRAYGGVGDWMATFNVYDDVRARIALPATPMDYARGLVDVLVRHNYPVAEFVEAVLARTPVAIRHPVLGGVFKTNAGL